MATAVDSRPDVLFKYVGFQCHHLDILRKLRIRFTQPDDLNDPFDCVPGVAPPVDVEKFVDDTFARNQSAISRRGLTGLQVATGRATMIAEYRAQPEKLVARCFEIVRKNLNEVGVLSLASDNSNLAMWAHYGESHRGFAIGLRTDGAPLTKRAKEFTGEGELRPVVYGAGRVIVPCDPLDIPADLLFRKGQHWSNEEEWRLVRRLSACDIVEKDLAGKDRFHMCRLDPATVVRLDIGENADSATIDAIMSATSPGSPLQHVEVYRARMDAGRVGFQFERI